MLFRTGSGDEFRQYAAFAAWVAAAGRQVSKITVPVRLDDKTLIVAVSDETWRSQLKGMSGQLLFKLNALLGERSISRLEFIISDVASARESRAPRRVDFVAPDEQASYLEDRVADMAPSLRAVFMRAAGKCLDRRARLQA